MRKSWICLLAVLAVIAAGCLFRSLPAPSAPVREPVLVGFINIADGRIFSGSLQRRFADLAVQNPELQVVYCDGQGKASVQNQRIHDLLDQGAKVIVLMAADPVDVLPGLQEAHAAGVPVITLNIRCYGGASIYVGVEDYDAGWQQGEYMCDHLHPGGTVAYISGPQKILSAQQRLRGFTDACLLRRPDIHLQAFAESAYDSQEQAADIMRSWLRQGLQPDAVVGGNDEIAIGAWKALKEMGHGKGVLISGIDATSEARDLIRAGYMAQSVRQDSADEAQEAYQVLLQILQDQNANPEDVIVPFVSLTRENVDDF